jgi:hypothetical protein
MKPHEELCNRIKSMQYGETILHDEIKNIVGEKSRTTKYFSIVGKAQALLLKEGKALQNVRDIGYKVLNPDDYTDAAIREYRLGFRRLTAGENLLIAAPESDMSDEGRKNYREVSDKARALHASLAGGIVELKLLNKKHPLLTQSNEK